MAVTGTTTLNFGTPYPQNHASATVTGQVLIGALSFVDAWVSPVATADHSVDEHVVEEIDVKAGNIVVGTGFTIYGLAPSGTQGSFTVNWVWV